MTVYTVFQQSSAPEGSPFDPGLTQAYGMYFQLSEDCSLTGIWFYSQSGSPGAALPSQCEIWEYPSETLVAQDLAPSWSGAEGSGWVKDTFDGSVTLSADTWYVVTCDNNDASIFTQTTNYWTSGGGGAGGITNGVLYAPDADNSPVGDDASQGVYATTAGAFPTSNYADSNWWVDVEVTYTSGGTAADVTGVGSAVSATGGTGSLAAGSDLTGSGAAVSATGGVGVPGTPATQLEPQNTSATITAAHTYAATITAAHTYSGSIT